MALKWRGGSGGVSNLTLLRGIRSLFWWVGWVRKSWTDGQLCIGQHTLKQLVLGKLHILQPQQLNYGNVQFSTRAHPHHKTDYLL